MYIDVEKEDLPKRLWTHKSLIIVLKTLVSGRYHEQKNP